MKILGCGNVNMGDDGFGLEMLKELKKYEKEWNLQLIEVNWGGISILDHFEGEKKVIILDAFNLSETPGTVFNFNMDELSLLVKNKFLTTHDIGVMEAIKLGEKICPEKIPSEIRFIGVQTGKMEAFSQSITPEVRMSFSKIIDLIHKEVSVENQTVS